MANEIEKLKVELLDPELVALADKGMRSSQIVAFIEDGFVGLDVKNLQAPWSVFAEFDNQISILTNDQMTKWPQVIFVVISH